MITIFGDRVDGIEARVHKRERWSGLSINISMRDVKEGANGVVEFHYAYAATYGDKVAEIKIEGVMFARFDSDEEKEKVLNLWKEKKKVPKEHLAVLLNAINYACSAHGTIIARVLNFAPPLIPPRLRVEAGGEKEGEAS